MIPAGQASAASNAKSYNSTKDGATMTPHSGKNVSNVSQSVGKKRRHLEDIETNIELLRIALEGKELVEITGNLLAHSR